MHSTYYFIFEQDEKRQCGPLPGARPSLSGTDKSAPLSTKYFKHVKRFRLAAMATHDDHMIEILAND